jgi:hypothetical protein
MIIVYRAAGIFVFILTVSAVTHQTSFLKFLVDRPENKAPAAIAQKTTLNTAVPTAPPKPGRP